MVLALLFIGHAFGQKSSGKEGKSLGRSEHDGWQLIPAQEVIAASGFSDDGDLGSTGIGKGQ
jgi:hypothetical protein